MSVAVARYQNFVGGDWVDAVEGDTTEIINPATGESIGEVPEGSQYEVYKAITAHDTRFHDLILAIAGNEAIRAAFERTHCHLPLFRLYYAGGIGGQALREHRLIVDAIASGDVRASREAMRAHLKASLNRLRQVYR